MGVTDTARTPKLSEMPEGCYRQPTETDGIDSEGRATKTIIVKGAYADVHDLFKTLSRGCLVISGWEMQTANISHANGAGVLNIVCNEAEPEEGTPGTADDTPLSIVWSVKSVRNDKSILAYCGSGPAAPLRGLVEAWMKEPDGTLAAAMSFTKADGSVCNIANLRPSDGPEDPDEPEGSTGVVENLNPKDKTPKSPYKTGQLAGTRELITKIMNGIDSVMRFYPMLTKTTVYKNAPKYTYTNLATIETPTAELTAGVFVSMPGNISKIIEGHKWIKCQDDYQLTADGKHTRVESWIGSDDMVDENLYGTGSKRWSMPYDHDKFGGH